MAEPLYGVYGASGFGREVIPLARQVLAETGESPERLVFVDDGAAGQWVNGHRVLDFEAFAREPASQRFAVLAVADGTVRERLAQRLVEAGIQPWSVRAAQTLVMDDVGIGEGAILCPFVTLTSNIRIGRHFHANLYSYVAHDCVIGDFVTFAPAVRCNGNVVIEDHAYIGTGAILRQGTPGAPLVIGRSAVVGMGAVVTKSVPPGVTVVGNPARPLSK